MTQRVRAVQVGSFELTWWDVLAQACWASVLILGLLLLWIPQTWGDGPDIGGGAMVAAGQILWPIGAVILVVHGIFRLVAYLRRRAHLRSV